ncbi:MAG TPA: uroporphyrinogen decarboxylase family protein [Candidatus Hydrogenedentes bacterium]|nr:uroporphyrinogen decarboxylase family protein [Candidatus Hydrogenedentota bacterium]HQH54115.1 uroporphyrinogen decarboxylase family protein [Candidatus Hydrogenedentota bacterium]
MTNRERVLAILNYKPYDRMPIVHFGFWTDTLDKWAAEGHITREEADEWADGNPWDIVISEKLGFDFNYYCCYSPNTGLKPDFEREVIEELPDGGKKVRNAWGVIELEKPGATSIPAEIDHLLKTRKDWEQHYKHRLQFKPARVTGSEVLVNAQMVPWNEGGLEFLQKDERDYYYGLHCGSLFGEVRNILGVTGASYLFAEDDALFTEIIDTRAELSYQAVKMTLESGAKFDFAHFWEDICFKNGPLIIPSVFDEKVGPHYKRITELVNSYGITIVSLDCDGCIDALIPTWLNNGVNTMFPIEVGTWNASIAPWRKQYGKELRGVGGMNKVVFARDRAAIDAEVERLKPLVELGAYVPCPDHRLAPDAKWDNVRYYCDRMRETFS